MLITPFVDDIMPMIQISKLFKPIFSIIIPFVFKSQARIVEYGNFYVDENTMEPATSKRSTVFSAINKKTTEYPPPAESCIIYIIKFVYAFEDMDG